MSCLERWELQQAETWQASLCWKCSKWSSCKLRYPALGAFSVLNACFHYLSTLLIPHFFSLLLVKESRPEPDFSPETGRQMAEREGPCDTVPPPPCASSDTQGVSWSWTVGTLLILIRASLELLTSATKSLNFLGGTFDLENPLTGTGAGWSAEDAHWTPSCQPPLKWVKEYKEAL